MSRMSKIMRTRIMKAGTVGVRPPMTGTLMLISSIILWLSYWVGIQVWAFPYDK